MREIDFNKKFYFKIAIMNIIVFIACGYLHELGHMVTYNLLHPDMILNGYTATITWKGIIPITSFYETTVVKKFWITVGGILFLFPGLFMKNKVDNLEYFSGWFAIFAVSILEVLIYI
jgi:hypothetical protein